MRNTKANTKNEAEGENVSDLFRKFVFSRAEAHGMMRGGKVVDGWRERVRESAAIIRANKRKRSESRKKKATA